MCNKWSISVLPLPLSELFIAGCCRSNLSTYFHQVYDDNRWWISRYQTFEREVQPHDLRRH